MKRATYTPAGVVMEDYESKEEKVIKDIDTASTLQDIKTALKAYFKVD